jgi:hypothetical protein
LKRRSLSPLSSLCIECMFKTMTIDLLWKKVLCSVSTISHWKNNQKVNSAYIIISIICSKEHISHWSNGFRRGKYGLDEAER